MAQSLWSGLQGSIPLGIQLGLQAYRSGREDEQLQLARQREERIAKLQERQEVLGGIEAMMKISAIPDRGTRNHLFGLYAQRATTADGQPIFGPDTVATFQKMGDEQRQQVMDIFSNNLELLGNMSPDQLAGMFRDPLEAMKYLDELGKQTEQKRKMAAQKAGEEAWSRVQLEGDVGQRILSVQSAIQAAGAAGADTSKLNQHLNALLSQQQQAATERHQRAQEGISAGNLAVSRANLGLRQQELSLSKSSNPAERYAAEMFDQPFNRLTTAQRAQVNDRVSAESLERAQQMGAVQAGQRATPAQQTEELAAMQSSLDTLDFIEQKLNDEFVGPVRGGMQAYAMEKAGGMSEQEIDFRAALASYENILTLLRSGAAVTASESVRLTRETPKATDRPEQLRGKLRTARQILQNAMKRRKEALVTGGYGQVPTFTQPDVSTPERPNATHRYNPETGRIEAID